MPTHNSTRSLLKILCYSLVFVCLNSLSIFSLGGNKAIAEITLTRSEPLDNRRIPRSSGERLQEQQEQFRQRQQQLRERYKQELDRQQQQWRNREKRQIQDNREHRREDRERTIQRNELRRERRNDRLNERLIIQPR